MTWYLEVKVAHSCLTLCNPMEYTVHGILQAKILEWEAFPFSRGSSQPRDQNPCLPHCRWILYQLSHKENPRILEWVAYPFSSRSSWPRNWTRVSCIAGGFFTNWAIREALIHAKLYFSLSLNFWYLQNSTQYLAYYKCLMNFCVCVCVCVKEREKKRVCLL